MTLMALDAAWRFIHPRILAHVLPRLHAFCSIRSCQKKHGAEYMETIIGKQTNTLDKTDFAARLIGYQQIVMDIGTGDGRYVALLARSSPE